MTTSRADAAKKKGGRTTPKKEVAVDVNKLCAQILDGRADGGLVRIVEAVHSRLMADEGTSKRWKVTYTYEDEERSFTEDDQTLDSVAAAEAASGKPAAFMDPQIHAADLRALIAADVATRDGLGIKDALEWTGGLDFHETLQALTYYEVPAVPKDPTPSTAT